MPIDAGQRVDEIRWVGDNQIVALLYILKEIAGNDAHILDAVERGIDAAVAQRQVVDIGESEDRTQLRRASGRVQSADAAARPDVEDSERPIEIATASHLRYGSLDHPAEAVRVRAEEDRIGSLRRVGRMHIELIGQGRESYTASRPRALRFEDTCGAGMASDPRVDVVQTKRTVPAEHVGERRGLLHRPRQNPRVARRRDRGEAVAEFLQGSAQTEKRGINCIKTMFGRCQASAGDPYTCLW